MNTPDIRIRTIIGYVDSTLKNVTNRTPKQRLAYFRALAASYASKDWRDARAAIHVPEVSPLSAGFNSKDYGLRKERTPVMYGFNLPMFRDEVWADQAADVNMDHSGWFTDADCSATLRAFVFRLPHGRFGCGYADSDTGQRTYLLEVHPDARSAAASADHEAEHYAEEAKEYSERWQAAQNARSDVTQKEKEVREGYALRNRKGFDYIREEVRDDIAKLRDLREAAEEYKDIEE